MLFTARTLVRWVTTGPQAKAFSNMIETHIKARTSPPRPAASSPPTRLGRSPTWSSAWVWRSPASARSPRSVRAWPWPAAERPATAPLARTPHSRRALRRSPSPTTRPASPTPTSTSADPLSVDGWIGVLPSRRQGGRVSWRWAKSPYPSAERDTAEARAPQRRRVGTGPPVPVHARARGPVRPCRGPAGAEQSGGSSASAHQSAVCPEGATRA